MGACLASTDSCMMQAPCTPKNNNFKKGIERFQVGKEWVEIKRSLYSLGVDVENFMVLLFSCITIS